jgi:hypothetical protein
MRIVSRKVPDRGGTAAAQPAGRIEVVGHRGGPVQHHRRRTFVEQRQVEAGDVN